MGTPSSRVLLVHRHSTAPLMSIVLWGLGSPEVAQDLKLQLTSDTFVSMGDILFLLWLVLVVKNIESSPYQLLSGGWGPKASFYNFLLVFGDACWIKCIPRSAGPSADLGSIFVSFHKAAVNRCEKGWGFRPFSE